MDHIGILFGVQEAFDPWKHLRPVGTHELHAFDSESPDKWVGVDESLGNLSTRRQGMLLQVHESLHGSPPDLEVRGLHLSGDVLKE
eukprot:CAMPEP_0181498986 /NCGR_PEP_ID=MMETSP1110-20121109/54404_1 /TAXON_ID=174948 /ORGANISM="Symbiodinium sp., Strain CCMP421" /LENGTH=85 /DNA_ID=CAMNT_0023627115 /DNA_START=118 /DNA_END=372 /DNA_ORIENTATION=+